METTIVLTMREQKRVEVIQRVFRGEMTMGEAALVLGVTERHSYRIKARIRKEGVKGVIHHRGWGQTSTTQQSVAKYRVAVDTGGTFSDFVFFNKETGEGSTT